jgi:hypothetical protein
VRAANATLPLLQVQPDDDKPDAHDDDEPSVSASRESVALCLLVGFQVRTNRLPACAALGAGFQNRRRFFPDRTFAKSLSSPGNAFFDPP